ncbi:hypothetical protein [Tepidimonas sp.]|uniref:hypothetical protein n=1 Tax=Tepidimonas sp. TaxID=2002775 RepID=UPI00391DD15E
MPGHAARHGPNQALISKGLRLLAAHRFDVPFKSEPSPDFKGIKTRRSGFSFVGFGGSEPSPDFKGIKTGTSGLSSARRQVRTKP